MHTGEIFVTDYSKREHIVFNFSVTHLSQLLSVSCGKQSASCLTSFQETKQ